MAYPKSPDPPSHKPSAIFLAPACPTCKVPMRLAQVEPHSRFISIDEWVYECACGHKETQLVRSSSLTRLPD